MLALPAEKVRPVLRLQVGSSERKVQVVFVISLDVLVIPSIKLDQITNLERVTSTK